MKIGIISDSHDNIANLQKAIVFMQVKGVSKLIHCGDLCSPFMIDELSKFKGEIHCIFGNTDDRFNTPKRAETKQINFHGDIGHLEVEKRKIIFNHFPQIAMAFAKSGEYDAVFFGHTHKAERLRYANCLLLNPGELMGRFGKISVALYDTKSNDAEIVYLD